MLYLFSSELADPCGSTEVAVGWDGIRRVGFEGYKTLRWVAPKSIRRIRPAGTLLAKGMLLAFRQ